MGKTRTFTLIAITVISGLVGVGCGPKAPATPTAPDTTPVTKTVKFDDGTTLTTTTYPDTNNSKSVEVFPSGETITTQIIQGTGTTIDTSWAVGSPSCPSGKCSTEQFIGTPTLSIQDQGTKDVDLQRAELQDQKMDDKAQSIASQFGMTFQSAHQLAQLSDKLQSLGGAGALSDEDREALSNAALSVAGIHPDDVNQAVAHMIKDGDQKPLNDLINQAAVNLGMPSSAGLRDQLLPSLGINF